MLKGIIGKKLGMTQIFHEDGRLIPVTVIQAGPCPVVQIKTPTKEKYSALQLGFEEESKKRVKKPLQGHCAKAQVPVVRHLREFLAPDVSSYQVGQAITVEEFQVGDRVDVTGVSKGKGFMGVVKRWGFPRRTSHPRLYVSSSSGIHWRQLLSFPGLAGPEDGGARGKPESDPAKPGSRGHPAQTEFALDQGSGPGGTPRFIADP